MALRRAGGSAVFAKVFDAAIAQPNALLLRNLVFLRFGEPVVELKRFFAFTAAGAVVVSFPIGHGDADAASRFFD